MVILRSSSEAAARPSCRSAIPSNPVTLPINRLRIWVSSRSQSSFALQRFSVFRSQFQQRDWAGKSLIVFQHNHRPPCPSAAPFLALFTTWKQKNRTICSPDKQIVVQQSTLRQCLAEAEPEKTVLIKKSVEPLFRAVNVGLMVTQRDSAEFQPFSGYQSWKNIPVFHASSR